MSLQKPFAVGPVRGTAGAGQSQLPPGVPSSRAKDLSVVGPFGASSLASVSDEQTQSVLDALWAYMPSTETRSPSSWAMNSEVEDAVEAAMWIEPCCMLPT